ncbi:phage holin family protein [Klebsiella pneumoniae]|uniref:phage holin family protein n=4 Tax=Enterobacteriaceae TaxID=543 RepID=UPI0023E32DE2|nr:phage holin family protein [Klebsiella pneumoniae]
MQDKESIAGMSWLVLLIIACWGGLVRYLIDVKQSKATWSLINALAQMVVSGFTGVIAGLVSIESGLSIYMILATAGISGAMGSVGHCCKVSDEAAFCLIQRPYISKTLLTRRISPRGSP